MIDARHLRPNLTPSKLLDLPQHFGWGLSAFDMTPTSGFVETDIIPNRFTCSEVRISLTSGDTSSIVSVDIYRNGTSIFEVPVSIDISGTTSVGSTAPYLFNLSASTFNFLENDRIYFYVSGATNCLGLKVKLIGNRII